MNHRSDVSTFPTTGRTFTDTIETNVATSMGFPCRVVARIVNIGSTSIVKDADGPSQGMTINHNRTNLVVRLLQCLAYDQLSCDHVWNSPPPVDVSGRDVVRKGSITINKRELVLSMRCFIVVVDDGHVVRCGWCLDVVSSPLSMSFRLITKRPDTLRNHAGE